MNNNVVLVEKDILSQIESTEINLGLLTGLVIGQEITECSSAIFHIPRTHVLDSQELNWKVHIFENPEDATESLIHHAQHVNDMLSGGSDIHGIYFIGPNNIFKTETERNTVKFILDRIGLVTKNKNVRMAFSYNTSNNRFTFMRINPNGDFNPLDWVIYDNRSSWFEVNMSLNLGQLPSFRMNSELIQHKVEEFLEQLSLYLKDTKLTLNGIVYPEDHIVMNIEEAEETPEYSGNHRVFIAKLFKNKREEEDENFNHSHGHISLNGTMSLITYTHTNSTIGFLEKAIKKDMTRSMRKRLQLYWERKKELKSDKDVETVECLPRRILFTPNSKNIWYSFYVFDDKEIENIYFKIKVFLDIDGGFLYEIEEEWGDYNIQNPTRRNIFTENLEDVRPYYITMSDKGNDTMDIISELEQCHHESEESPQEKKMFNKFSLGIAAAASVAILSIIIYIYC